MDYEEDRYLKRRREHERKLKKEAVQWRKNQEPALQANGQTSLARMKNSWKWQRGAGRREEAGVGGLAWRGNPTTYEENTVTEGFGKTGI